MTYEKEKQEIRFWGLQLHRQGINFGRSGNISKRVGDKILITAHESYLGFLDEDDILVMDKDGKIVEGKKEPTSEKLLHVYLYQYYPQKQVIIHAHPPYTVHYFHSSETLTPITLEERVYLGKVGTITQKTPTITDIQPVQQALDTNDIVVIKDHGVVAIGENFKYTFSLIELLEVNARVRLTTTHSPLKTENPVQDKKQSRKYKLFSPDHINALVEVINSDESAQSLGKEYDLTTTICTKVTNSEEVFSYCYEQGKIVEVKYSDDGADFVFSAKRGTWQNIFAGDLDPFVARTQGKIKLKGDFNLLSQWFPIFERTFSLWMGLPLEQ
jgi:ribulose-5-phosphate 4-epimerase/fuculose-1-phosphate aldolase